MNAINNFEVIIWQKSQIIASHQECKLLPKFGMDTAGGFGRAPAGSRLPAILQWATGCLAGGDSCGLPSAGGTGGLPCVISELDWS